MLAIERRREILSRLGSEGKVIVAELARDFAVTEETVRRDLERLDKEGLASKTIEILGVDIGITLKERDNGSIRVSVRSTECADSSAVCREFEGGGHVRASGCRIFDTIENAERRLVEVCLKQLGTENL